MRPSGAPAVCLAALAVALTGVVRLAASPPPAELRLSLASRAQEDVRIAVEGALRRLASSQCAGILDDMRAPDGRTLSARLASTGLDAGTYLASLHFHEGDDMQACHVDSITVAFTQPGSRVVYICSERFTQAFPRNSATAEVSILHEFLHSLGLGENPPSPSAISRLVRDRCSD